MDPQTRVPQLARNYQAGISSSACTELMMDEILRKIAHLVIGTCIAIFILFADRELAVGVIGTALLAGCILSDALRRGFHIPFITWLIDRMERRDAVPGWGAMFFVVSALICVILFDTFVAFTGIFVLAVFDSMATVVGKGWGRTTIIGGKTLEGSLGGFFMTLIALLLFAPLETAMFSSFTAGIVELLSPVDDNLTIPLAVCLILQIL